MQKKFLAFQKDSKQSGIVPLDYAKKNNAFKVVVILRNILRRGTVVLEQ